LKLADYDFKVESLNQREFNEDLRRLWNNSLYEVKVISTASPSWTEDVDGILVLSTYGGVSAQRLYVSNLKSANGWSYVVLTDL
jgi:hypothetical protein